jgi:hypothetical protein
VIRWMLTRMEKSPSAVFYEKELTERFPNEFEQAKREKLLRHVETPLDGGSYGLGRSRPLTVVSVGDKFEAFDDEDPEFDPIELTPADLARWRLDLKALAWRFQQANGLDGKPDALDDRLFFMGEAKRDDLSLAFVLALLPEERSARRVLTALPNLLSGMHDRIVAVCPSYFPTQAERRHLESLQVFVVTPNDVDLFKVDLSQVLREPLRKAPRIVLSDKEEEEFGTHGFKSRLPIVITGRTERRAGNVVEVGGAAVVLTDVPFRLFLRLVVALYETENGFLPRGSMMGGGGLVAEGFYTEEGLDQAVHRLRVRFGPALPDLKPTQFIEIRGGQLRLSTHPRYIACERDRLLRHADQMVRDLAERIQSAGGSGRSRAEKLTDSGSGEPLATGEFGSVLDESVV